MGGSQPALFIATIQQWCISKACGPLKPCGPTGTPAKEAIRCRHDRRPFAGTHWGLLVSSLHKLKSMKPASALSAISDRVLLMPRAIVVALATLVLVACGSDDEGGDEEGRILHFPEQDVSVEDYRAYLRSGIATNAIGWQILCANLHGLSDDAALNFFRNSPNDDIPPLAGATPKPGQESDDESMVRAVQVVKSECAR